MVNQTLTAAQLLAENGYVVDTSTVTFTAQNILSEQNYTTTQCPLTTMELLCDNAITYTNLQANTNIALMTGTPGSKTASMTGTQAAVVKQLCALMLRARQDKGPNAGIRDISVTATISDPQYALYSETIKLGLVKLQALSTASVEQQIVNAINYVELHTGLTLTPAVSLGNRVLVNLPAIADDWEDMPLLWDVPVDGKVTVTMQLNNVAGLNATYPFNDRFIGFRLSETSGGAYFHVMCGKNIAWVYGARAGDEWNEGTALPELAGTEKIVVEADGATGLVTIIVDDEDYGTVDLGFRWVNPLTVCTFYFDYNYLTGSYDGQVTMPPQNNRVVCILDSKVMGVVKLLASAYLRGALNGKGVERTTLDMINLSCEKLYINNNTSTDSPFVIKVDTS